MQRDSAYIDTSILGAYYCPEALSAIAEKALRHVAVPVISMLSDVEFSSLIARKRRLKELDERQAQAIVALYETHIAEGFYRRISLTSEHFLRGRHLVSAVSSGLRTLDALHLAVAMSESLTLITADRIFAAAAKHHKSDAILVK